jgi:hypothetical protein
MKPPQKSVATHTFRPQHEPTMHTLPNGQSVLEPQPASPLHGVSPLTQKPWLELVDPQTQLPPGPHALKEPHVLPLHESKAHAPLVQVPEGHCAYELVWLTEG